MKIQLGSDTASKIKQHGRVIIGAFLLIGIGFVLGWFVTPPGPGFTPRFLIADVPNIPEASDTFDCKKASIFLYDYFTNKGYECQIIAGNLELTEETLFDCNHTWVLANKPGDDNAVLAFDWGHPCIDKQHYEGYEISYEQLKDEMLDEQN